MATTPTAHTAHVTVTGNITINVLLSFAFGVLFLTTMLGFSIYFPNPSDFQVRTWITCLALSAAGIGAILPGFLEVRYKSVLRATGAVGFFVVVYMLQPTLAKSVPTYPEPSEDARPLATSFLGLLDDGKVAEAYKALDTDAQKAFVDFPTFQSLYQNDRAFLGAPESRLLVASDSTLNPTGYPPGRFRSFGYKSKFAGQCRTEQVVVRAGQDLKWHIWTYVIALATMPC